VADLDPNWKRIAQLTRMLGSRGGERRNAFAALERTMQSERITWSDYGNRIEHGRAQQHSNGHIMLPGPSEMAEYCQQRPNRLKDDAQRRFIDEMYVKTRRGINLQRGTLGYLASIYIKLGGSISC
jgi:hypothetical protein